MTGGSPRYRLYPTSDGKVLAAAPLEQQFWNAFVEVIGLPEKWRDDAADPAGSAAAVAALIAARPASHWEERIRGVDCCCSIVRSLEEALADPHFRDRGLFAERLGNEQGEEMPALPLPIDRAFRAARGAVRSAPPLGER